MWSPDFKKLNGGRVLCSDLTSHHANAIMNSLHTSVDIQKQLELSINIILSEVNLSAMNYNYYYGAAML